MRDVGRQGLASGWYRHNCISVYHLVFTAPGLPREEPLPHVTAATVSMPAQPG